MKSPFYFPGKPRRLSRTGLLIFGQILILSSLIFSQNSYTFTTCGATGSVGPTQAQVNSSYSLTNLNGSVTLNPAGIQNFTVPVTGVYRIEAFGARGYGASGGKGAMMSGDFTLTTGQILKIIAGQQGLAPVTGSLGYGGGGGSYVATSNNIPMIVAGGGGGSWAQVFSGLSDGTVVVNGNSGASGTQNTAGGTSGAGGLASNNTGAGGGFYGNGAGTAGGLAFVNGGTGGSAYSHGGFGGGGGSTTNDHRRGCGGGGYSGGGISHSNTGLFPEGGGGGSFNSGTNQTNQSGTNNGDGKVIITEHCSISIGYAVPNIPGPVCAGSPVTLTTSAVSNYSWSNGATSSSITITPTLTGSYSLTATNSQSCNAFASITVTVVTGPPTLTVVNSASAICTGNTATLTASGADTYTWTGNVLNGVAFSPPATSGYTVSGSNVCGTSSTSTSVTVNSLPTLTVSVSTPTVCSGSTVTFSASGASTYSWTGGVTNSVPFAPGVTGNYTVTGTNASGCFTTAIASISVVQTPTSIALSSPPLICIGASSTFSTTGATSYTWIWPGGTSNQPSFIITPTTAPAVIIATVSKSNFSCVHTQTVQLIVNQLPFIQTIATPTLVCAGKPVNLTAAGALGYTWNPGATPGQSITVFPPVTTDYTVTASNGTCVNTAIQTISANPNPTITISSSSSVVCQHDVATLSLNGATGYTWVSPPVLFGSNNAVVTVTPLSTTVYSVSGVNIHNCISTMSLAVTVHPTPTLNTNANNPLVCTGAPSTISATGASSYSWSNGATTPVTVVNPAITTVYTVTGFNDNTGCNSSKTTVVSVFSPTFQVPVSASACIGGTVTLSANGANSYTWNGVHQFPSIAVSPSVYTVYHVAATSSSLGPVGPVSCVSSNTVGVSIYTNPTISALAKRGTICKNETVELVGSGAATYTWSTLQQGTTVTVQPPPTGQITYSVLGADSSGCMGTALVTVKISACTGIGQQQKEWDVDVYPNPSQGKVFINSDRHTSLEIVDQMGRVIRTEILNAGNKGAVFIEGLEEGIYYLRLHSNGEMMMKRVVIVR